MYLALTGARLTGHEMQETGLATHMVRRQHGWSSFRQHLSCLCDIHTTHPCDTVWPPLMQVQGESGGREARFTTPHAVTSPPYLPL